MTKFPNWYNKVLLYLLIFNHLDIIFTEELEKGSNNPFTQDEKKDKKEIAKCKQPKFKHTKYLGQKINFIFIVEQKKDNKPFTQNDKKRKQRKKKCQFKKCKIQKEPSINDVGPMFGLQDPLASPSVGFTR